MTNLTNKNTQTTQIQKFTMNYSSPYSIKKISALETIPVRHPVLRPGKPIETCHFDGDQLKSTFHLGIYNESQLLGVVSYFKSVSPLISNTSQYQLRGMAVLEAYQGKGLGNKLVIEGFKYLKEKNVEILWCNAREEAVNFYKKHQFKIISDAFVIPDVGPHYVMSMRLD